jgi:anti-anti-sigma regulatory factor
MNLAIEEVGDRLTLSGLLTIAHGHELQKALSGFVSRSSQAFVSLAGVEDVDAAGLQILFAARTEALRSNKAFAWTEISAACRSNAALAGMSRFLGFQEQTEFPPPE